MPEAKAPEGRKGVAPGASQGIRNPQSEQPRSGESRLHGFSRCRLAEAQAITRTRFPGPAPEDPRCRRCLQAGCVPTHQRATSLRSFALGFVAWDHCPERMQDVSDGTMVPSYGKRLLTIVNGVSWTGWCIRTLPARLQRCQGRPDPGAQRRSSSMLSSRPKRNCRSVVAWAP